SGCNNSDTTHSTPNPNNIPRYGGKWVRVLNTGTDISAPIPRKSIRRPPFTSVVEWSASGLLSSFFFNRKPSTSTGTRRQTRLGKNNDVMMARVDTCPPIHSMVVVTSPMGVHAPPALAAIIIIPANVRRISLSGISLRINDTITIDVVRLSSIADRKNVTRHMIHSRVLGLRV